MLGAILMAVVLVFVLPPMFLMAGAVVSALLGYAGKTDAEARHEGSELVDLNV